MRRRGTQRYCQLPQARPPPIVHREQVHAVAAPFPIGMNAFRGARHSPSTLWSLQSPESDCRLNRWAAPCGFVVSDQGARTCQRRTNALPLTMPRGDDTLQSTLPRPSVRGEIDVKLLNIHSDSIGPAARVDHPGSKASRQLPKSRSMPVASRDRPTRSALGDVQTSGGRLDDLTTACLKPFRRLQLP